MVKVLVVIPARGGSKGIPRKNIRPLAGKPLIQYSVNTALSLNIPNTSIKVLVSSDDDEILETASRAGATIYKRSSAIAQDVTTLDPVIYDAFKNCGFEAEVIATIQPTSPLLKPSTLESAIKKMIEEPGIDTILSVVEDKHLCWTTRNGNFVPAYKERVNRQQLPDNFKETGSFLITRNTIISEHSRIGSHVYLEVISPREAIDIDTFEDWNICEYYLKHKKILFNVSGYKEIGLGHVYNSLSIAHEILDHEVDFLFDKDSTLGYEKVRLENYNARLQQHDDLLDDINEMNPDIIINDCLDTKEDFILGLKRKGYKVINFEDLGVGAVHADLVINAMYPEREPLDQHYYGKDYFVLRDEFTTLPATEIQEKVKNVLISFGGVDPNNYTFKVLSSIHSFCQSNNIKIVVVAGHGYTQFESIENKFNGVEVRKDIKFISNAMAEADIAFTSAGRTTFEIASLGVPTIVLAQNEREGTHFFASNQNGFLNLGMGTQVSDDEVLQAFSSLVIDYPGRKKISAQLLSHNLRQGKRRVIALIKQLINE